MNKNKFVNVKVTPTSTPREAWGELLVLLDSIRPNWKGEDLVTEVM